MKDLIEALTILYKYAPELNYPFHCEHDVLYVDVSPNVVSDKDKLRLEQLGFLDGTGSEDGFENGFYSFRYGSC